MGVMGGMIPFITGRGPPCISNVPTSTRCNLRSCDLKAVMLADQTFLAGFFGPDAVWWKRWQEKTKTIKHLLWMCVFKQGWSGKEWWKRNFLTSEISIGDTLPPIIMEVGTAWPPIILWETSLVRDPFSTFMIMGGRVGRVHDTWSNYSDLTRPDTKWWFSEVNPLISGKPRLVKYYNLARLYPT